MVHHTRKPTVTEKVVSVKTLSDLSIVNDLLLYLDELKIVWYVLLS